MSSPTPVTQRDVAQVCGLHPSTVCLALKNSPSIPLETRRRIQAIAEELGYQPNVGARNLALLRTEKRTGGSLPLAWINQEPRRDHWRIDPEARTYFGAARRRAEELGYHLEDMWTAEPGMSAPRVVQILRARGIEGVIFPAHRQIDFSVFNASWSDFALVGFNDHRLGEWIDVVCPDYYKNMDTALRHLRRLGFERVGLVLTSQFEAATSGLPHSCFLRHQGDAARGDRVPVCFASDDANQFAATFAAWFREHRPDAVVCRDQTLAAWGRTMGFATTWVQLHGGFEHFDVGVNDYPAEIATGAVDFVVDKMRRYEKGLRDSTRVHLIKGVWDESRLKQRERETVVA